MRPATSKRMPRLRVVAASTSARAKLSSEAVAAPAAWRLPRAHGRQRGRTSRRSKNVCLRFGGWMNPGGPAGVQTMVPWRGASQVGSPNSSMLAGVHAPKLPQK